MTNLPSLPARAAARSAGAFTSCSFFIAVALVLGAIAPPRLFAQRVEESYELRYLPPDEDATQGRWAYFRVDDDAHAMYGRDLLIGSGRVDVYGGPQRNDVLDYVYHADKLLRGGVMRLPDGLGEGFAPGAEWGFRNAIMKAVDRLDSILPKDPLLALEWPGTDQAVYELGRHALPFLQAYRGLEANRALTIQKAIERKILGDALKNVPPTLPGAGIDDTRQYTTEALAALALGPQALATLEEMAATAGNERVLEWKNWLAARYREVDQRIARAMNGDEATGKKGLQRGLPPSPADKETWTWAIRELDAMGLASIRPLEQLRAARHDYAVVADWLIGVIRRGVAERMLEDMTLMAEAGELKEDYFSTHVQDYLKVIGATEDVRTVANRYRIEALVMQRSGSEAEAKRAQAMLASSMAALAAVSEFIKADSASGVSRALENVRGNPGEAERWLGEAHKALDALKPAELPGALGALEHERQRMSAMQAKYNWLYEQIRLLDVQAAANVGVEWTPERERELRDKGVVIYRDRDGNPAEFKGHEDNDGRRYDFQNDVEQRGLSIELGRSETVRIPIPLRAGRTYRFSFEYFAKHMTRQFSWVRFVPLDRTGAPLYGDFAGWPESWDVGEWVPFAFARSPDGTEMTSNRVVGDTEGWSQPVRMTLRDVPTDVAGFTIEIKLNSVAGWGEFYFRNFRLDLLEEDFREGFEAEQLGDDAVAPPPNWQRLLDPARGYQPYSRLSYSELEKTEGQRSLLIEPNGFNVRLDYRPEFLLDSNFSYVFKGALRTESMQDMRAWFELMLFDEDHRPVTPDGLRASEGANVLRTPMRGDAVRSIGWRTVRTSDRWFEESFTLDDLRASALADKASSGYTPAYNPAIDTRERRTIRYAKVAVVVEGARPSYAAKVHVDALELLEVPRVKLTLGQADAALGPNLEPRFDEPKFRQGGDSRSYRVEQPPDGSPYKLFIEFEVTGLAPERAGYHYTLALRDYLGNSVAAADSLGAGQLDRIIYSHEKGTLETRSGGRATSSAIIPRVFLDDLNLANRFGYFEAHFVLRYADTGKPLVDRVFPIGFLPSPEAKKTGAGEFGVVLDRNTAKYRNVYRALTMLDVEHLAVPLFDPSMEIAPEGYANHIATRELDMLMRSLPRVRKTGVLDGMPAALAASYAGGASAIFGDAGRGEWRKLVEAAATRWRDAIEGYEIGAANDASFTTFAGDAANAFNTTGGVIRGAGQDWAEIGVPVTLASGADGQRALEALRRSFGARWKPALEAQAQSIRTAVTGALDVDQRRKLDEAAPPFLWLQRKERFSFYVPATMSTGDMRASAESILAAVARFEDVLGDDAAQATANARALATGGQVAFTGFTGAKSRPADHALFIEIQAADPDAGVGYGDQLRDLTEKVVTARMLGFSRIYVSRLRSTGDLPDGLLDRDNIPLPAFYAYRTLNAVLAGREYVPLQMPLASRLPHTFFRSDEGKDLSFIVFPGERDAIEELPFGTSAYRVDLMGNLMPLEAVMRPGPDGTPVATGAVRVQLPSRRSGGAMPIMIAGIDAGLLDTAMGISLDRPEIDAMESEQPRMLRLTNRFAQPVTFTLSVPLGADGEGGADNISLHARFKDGEGRELAAGQGALAFGTVELAPGESRDFRFSMMPRSSMRIGARVLPVVVVMQGASAPMLRVRVPVTIKPQVAVDSISIVEPPDAAVYDVVATLSNATGQAQALVMTVTLPEMEDQRPKPAGFFVPANGNVQASVSLRRWPKEQLDGKRLRVALRQAPGVLFSNADYIIRVDPVTRAITLVRDDQAAS